MNFDIIVIGSGPGGYVAAIRASQLGHKVAIVEKSELGGICLNWGCIPTKALLKSAQVFEYINHASDYGITVSDAKHDFGAVIKRSRGIAEGMSKGIQFLMKKNKIEIFRVTSGKRKTQNALNFLEKVVYNVKNKNYIKNKIIKKKIFIPNLGDHRICMSSFVLAALTGAQTKIKNFETVFTSSPSFLKVMKILGAKYEIQKEISSNIM